jgi:nucleoid-associated protein YgaU
MPLSRNSTKDIITNDSELYDDLFRDRGIKNVKQYESSQIYYPTTEELSTVVYETRVWKAGDRLYKLANELYGDSRYWWVIAQFNKKPTESHFSIGDTYFVPISLEQILELYRV